MNTLPLITRTNYAAAATAACLLAFGLAGTRASAAPAPGVHVVHAESVNVVFSQENNAADANAKSLTPPRSATFNAFGKSYEVILTAHDELNELGKRMGGSAIALRGNIAGKSASWVRLTLVGEKIHGLFWDGEQLIAIAPSSEVPSNSRAVSDEKRSNAKEGSLVFRLADTVIDANANTCAALSSPDSGAALYENLNRELKSALNVTGQSAKAGAANVVASRRLQLSALMDADYLLRYASTAEATDALITRINNVDGIFTAQLGIQLELTHAGTADAVNINSLPAPLSSGDLLQALGLARAGNAQLYGTGLTHLFTGRDLEGRAVGIAYVGGMCSQRYGVGLSQIYGSTTWYESLIVAHELGHGFGAGHDGEGECASIPNSYLMAATIGGNADQFSQCSLERMQRQAAQASCLLPTAQADFSMASNLAETRATVADRFVWSMTATNLGEAQVTNARVHLTLPPELTLHDAIADSAYCTIGASVIECELGIVAAHTLRSIRLNLSASRGGSYPISAVLTSTTDANTTNNSGQGTIVVELPPPPPANATPPSVAPPASEAQGGGAMEGYGLAALFVLLCLSHGRRRYVRR